MLSTRTVRKRRFSLPVAADCLSHEDVLQHARETQEQL